MTAVGLLGIDMLGVWDEGASSLP